MSIATHNWVEISYVPVEVHHIGDALIASATEQAVEIAQEDENVHVVCASCKGALSAQVFFGPCVTPPAHPEIDQVV